MAATNYGLVVFFSDYPKAIRRGEIALKSNHLISFKFDNNTGQFLGTVQASQRNKNYKVEVNILSFYTGSFTYSLYMTSHWCMSSEFCNHVFTRVSSEFRFRMMKHD